MLAVPPVPRYAIRARCMHIRATFEEKMAELGESVSTVELAAKQVRSSTALKRALEYTLALGNYLNGGTNKGGAWGFKLDTLGKISGTKTAEGNSTLLHYIARLLEAEGVEEHGSSADVGKTNLASILDDVGAVGGGDESPTRRKMRVNFVDDAKENGSGGGSRESWSRDGSEHLATKGAESGIVSAAAAEAAQSSGAVSAAVSAAVLLPKELAHVEAAGRLSWKDESAEVNALANSLKQVETQVKIDQVAAFTATMGKFHEEASERVAALVAQRDAVEKTCRELLAWFGEDLKTQPEEVTTHGRLTTHHYPLPRDSLPTTHHSLPTTTHHKLPTTHYQLPAPHYSPLTTHHYSLPTTHYFATHYPLLTTHYPLPTAYYPLPPTHYPLPRYSLPTTHYPLPPTH